MKNPSAKFDASGGMSGIINIVLKKNRKAGYKQIKNLKKMFKEKAVTVIKQKDIIIVND